jgi:hypothetical protein
MKTNPYLLINSLLAKYPDYDENSYSAYPEKKHVLIKVEKLLTELKVLELLPDCKKGYLVQWLLHSSPLTEYEREIMRNFAFYIDYY